MPKYTVAVRSLCEFAARRGDLDMRFTPSPSASQGIEGHACVAARRGPGHRREIALRGEFEELEVRGRADGYDASGGRLEEVKTYRGSLERQPPHHRTLHWAQAKVYGWLLCALERLPEIDVALVYLDIDSLQETVLVERCAAADLRTHFEQLCVAFLGWARLELAHRAARDEALARLRFPHADFRRGQRSLAEAVYKAARAKRCLMAQAPTGIGKTIGVLFPLLKATASQGLDRVFYLTAKTSGRALALDALAALRGDSGALPLRCLELVARDKACEHPDRACHGESCPLARGFYDRLPAARLAALDLPAWDRGSVRALAIEHGVCPYWMAQELARWSDVIVGDYNHFFGTSALLHGLAVERDWRVGVLVDEAHNLVPRARDMYSATLAHQTVKRLRKRAAPSLRKPLDRLHRQWNEMNRGQPTEYRVIADKPAKWLASLQRCAGAIAEQLAEQPVPDAECQTFYFDALHMLRLAESFGPHSLFDAWPTPDGWAVCLRNVLPAPFLEPRFAATEATVLFSATLQPARFYREMLGLPDDTASTEIESPFEAKQLAVRVARGISTRWRHRAASLDGIVERIAAQFHAQPGNYLAFFGSYEYLDSVAERFAQRHGDVPAWTQSRGMTEAQQAAFLERFRCGGQGIGFAVLGGSFAEAVDLPGDRLVGAFIATLGMPRFGSVNEEMRRRLDELCGAGFEYTYLFPGLQKVVQAAGRVIRTPSDHGVVHLLDDRFARPDVRRLLPDWWSVS